MKDCVSLEIAKKLKEAGWSQELCAHGTELFYITTHADKDAIWSREGIERWHGVVKEQTAAPTIGELLEALPKGIKISGEGPDEWGLSLYPRIGGEWGCNYEREGHDGVTCYQYPTHAPNPADALALLWMALKEKGIV